MASIAQSTASRAVQAENYRYLQELVYQGSGIVLGHDKQYLLEARLLAIAQLHGLAAIDDLCALLRSKPGEALHQQVVEAMTTNETYFFRDSAQYEAIRTVLLPELRALRGRQRALNCWSAAASTGQEAYSLAMLLTEKGFAGWDLRILGTDLSRQAIARARAARYLQIEVHRGLPSPYLTRFFVRHGVEWQLKEEIKRYARFECFDLRQPLCGFGPYDLVFCRNLLVYFDAPTRRRVLEEMHGTLVPGGWLLLGAGETPAGLSELYEPRTVGGATVYIAR